MKKITILISLFIGIMFGCQNSEITPIKDSMDNEQQIPLRETFDFTYKGKNYSSPYYMENDTLMVLEDEEVAVVYNKLQELPELAIHVISEEKIEYFDTYNDLFENLNLSRSTATYSIPNYIMKYTLHIYEHSNYNRNKAGKIQSLEIPILIPDLDAYGMDDMIS